MSVIGEINNVFEHRGKAPHRPKNQLDPARAQAYRLIGAFEAHDISRRKIPHFVQLGLQLDNLAY